MGSESKQFGQWLRESADAINAAGLNPELWPEIPEILAQGWPGVKVLVQGFTADESQSLGFIHHGFDDGDMDRYHRYYSRVNPWIATLRQMPVMRARQSDDTLPWWTFADGEFYNDFLKPQGDSEHGVAIKLFDEPGHFAWLGFQFGHDLADAYNNELQRAVQKLAPALYSAMSLNRDIAKVAATATIQQVIEAFAQPAMLVNAKCAVMLANAPAAAALGAAETLRLDVHGRLRLSDANAIAAVAHAIRMACGGAGAASNIAIRSPEGRIGAVISIFPVAIPAQASSQMAWLFPPERLALVLLRDLDTAPVVGEETLRRIFVLTAAEARLAVRLAAGEPFPKAAARLEIGKETARTHLRAIFAKTGTHRQSELVALLARLPAGNIRFA